jgi:CRISPR-associated exonuclease Cas4
MISVSDVKQYFYCPRVVYFMYVFRAEKTISVKQEYGGERHDKLEKQETRRKTARPYPSELEGGEKMFKVALKSEKLGLSGKLDLLVKKGEEYYPVEYKNSRGYYMNHKYQLMAYVLLVEDAFKTAVDKAFIYYIPVKSVKEIEVTDGLRRYTRQLIGKIEHLIETAEMPEPAKQIAKCRDCEFWNVCRRA